MKFANTILVWLALAAAALAWYVYQRQVADPQARASVEKRKASYQQQMAAPPRERVIQTSNGVLIEMQVPTDRDNIGFVEYQTCYVWRDATVPSASLSCPNAPQVVVEESP